MKSSMESIHVLSLYYLVPFLFILIGGILLAEFTSHPGIISRIVSGTRTKIKIKQGIINSTIETGGVSSTQESLVVKND